MSVLALHGYGHTFPPHEVTIAPTSGASFGRWPADDRSLLSANSPTSRPARFLFHAVLDYTWGPTHFFEGQINPAHVISHFPIAKVARQIAEAARRGQAIGTAACMRPTRGRAESAAEIDSWSAMVPTGPA